MNKLILWPENTVPVPNISLLNAAPSEEREKSISIDDNFPKGEIVKFFPNQGYGFMKDRVGREIYFSLSEMRLIGDKKEEHLKTGVTVGYDLSHAGRNLHVYKMKIY